MMRKGWIAGVTSVLLTAGMATQAEAQATARESKSPATRTKPCAPATTCKLLAYDTSCDLALASTTTGVAPAVARDVLAGFADYHAARNVNDGKYGNGSAWVSAAAGSWIKLDLGKPTTFNSIRFGRDRLKAYDDRDPGTVQIYTSLDDGAETLLFSGTVSGDGALAGGETVAIDGFRQTARYVKLVFSTAGVAVDEIEIHDLEDGVGGGGGASGAGCWATGTYGPVTLRRTTWMNVFKNVPAPQFAARINWALGPDGPVAAPAPRWLTFDPGLPFGRLATDGLSAPGTLLRPAGPNLPNRMQPMDGEGNSRGMSLVAGDLTMVAIGKADSGEGVRIGLNGFTINGPNHPLCLVPVHPDLWFRPTSQYDGQACPKGADGRMPVEPWILGPW